MAYPPPGQPDQPQPQYPQQQPNPGQQPHPPQAPYPQPPYPYGPPQQQPYPMYVGPYQAVTRSRKSTSHGLHLFLTICTCGMWGVFVWLPITIWHAFGRRNRSTTEYR